MPPSTAEALAASIALALRLGVQGYAPQVVADGYSLRVRIGPIITRVMTAGVPLRGDPLPWLEREVAVTRWLTAQEAAIVAPWIDPGPHEVNGLWVSVWPFINAIAPDEAVSPVDRDALAGGAEFGRCIAKLHIVLRDCPLPLPVLAGAQADIAAALREFDHPLLHRAARELLPRIAHWPAQPLHGDAHTGNLLCTDGGLRWIDFEDVCIGPVEWDLASATLQPSAAEGYSGLLDPQRLADCRALRRLQTWSSLLFSGDTTAQEQEPLICELAARF